MQTDTAPSTGPFAPEGANPLRDHVMALEAEFLKLEAAARTGLALAIASDQRERCSARLPGDRVHYMSDHLVDQVMALHQGYRELFALAIKGCCPRTTRTAASGGTVMA